MQGQVRLEPKPGAGARLQEPHRGLPGAAPRGARPSAPQSPRPTGGLPFSPGVTLRLQRAVCSACATAELQRRQLGGPSRFPTRAPSGGTVWGAWGCSCGPPRVCPCLCPSAVLGWSPCTSDSVTTWPVHVRSAWSSRLRGLRDRGGARRPRPATAPRPGGAGAGCSQALGPRGGLVPRTALRTRQPKGEAGGGGQHPGQEGPTWSPSPLTFSLRGAPGRGPARPPRGSAAALLRAAAKVERREFREQTILIKQTNEFIASARY